MIDEMNFEQRLNKETNEYRKSHKREYKKYELINSLVTTVVLTLGALALQFIQISLPNIPSHIKMSFTVVPELVIALIFGPLWGALSVAAKGLLYWLVTKSEMILILENIVCEAVFVAVVSIVFMLVHNSFKKKKYDDVAAIRFVEISIAVFVATVCFMFSLYLFRAKILYPYYINNGIYTFDEILSVYGNYDEQVLDLSMGIFLYDVLIKGAVTFVLGYLTTTVFRLTSKYI